MESYNKIVPSNRSGKKYMIVLRKKSKKVKTIHFGATGYEHYTSGHLDDERRKRYVDRHRRFENFNDETSASYYALNYLWRFKTFNEAKNWIYNDLKKKGYS